MVIRKLLILLIITIPIAVPQSTTDTQRYIILKGDIIELSKIITGECGICDDKEKYLVGSVVLNRVLADSFPHTIREVIREDNQFYAYQGANYKDNNTEIATNLILYNKHRNKKVLYFVHKKSYNGNFFGKKIVIVRKYHIFLK